MWRCRIRTDPYTGPGLSDPELCPVEVSRWRREAGERMGREEVLEGFGELEADMKRVGSAIEGEEIRLLRMRLRAMELENKSLQERENAQRNRLQEQEREMSLEPPNPNPITP